MVTDRNFGDFKKTFEKENGDLVFYAVSVRDYETLALNMAELKRYIQQQKDNPTFFLFVSSWKRRLPLQTWAWKAPMQT